MHFRDGFFKTNYSDEVQCGIGLFKRNNSQEVTMRCDLKIFFLEKKYSLMRCNSEIDFVIIGPEADHWQPLSVTD